MSTDAVRPRRRRWPIWLAGFALLIVAYVGFVAARLFLFQPEPEIGREVTFVEGPLRPDGTIDYVAALNQHWSEGVTPENNAAVPLIEAFGPSIVDPKIAGPFYELLQIEPPAGDGDTLVALDEWLRGQEIDVERREELLRADPMHQQPFTAEDYPELAAWVEQNTPALERIHEASRRERFFVPVLPVPPASTLIDADNALVLRSREAARLLRMRSVLRLNAGEVKGACEDSVACLRLARLVSHNPTMIGSLVGMAIDSLGASASESIVLSGSLTPELAKRFREEIEALPPRGDSAETVGYGERLVSLDVTQSLAAGRAVGTSGGTPFAMTRSLDRNAMLRTINSSYDSFVKAMQLEGYAARTKAVKDLEQNLKAGRPALADLVLAYLAGNRSGISKYVAKVLGALLTPSIQMFQAAEDRTVTKATLTRLGWALAEYRAVEGEFPETLDALQPDYVDELPIDFYSGGPLQYRRLEGGFIVYAVGPNGIDDGGLGAGECSPDECDDIRFGIPPSVESAP